MGLTTNFGRLIMFDRAHAETVDIKANTTKWMLLTSAYTPNKDHKYISDLAGELSGTGYTGGFGGSGRQALTGKAWAQDDTNDLIKLTCEDNVWPAINAGTIRYAAHVKEVSSDADSPVLEIVDVNPTSGITTDGESFTLKGGSSGILKSTSP